jgi:hypothetical protein
VPTANQARLISEQLRRQQEPPGPLHVGQQRRQVTDLEVGPVVVRVLDAEAESKPSASARDFLQQRLAGVKRSADMLRPARSFQPAKMQAQAAARRQPQQPQQQQQQPHQQPRRQAVAGKPQAKRLR